MRFAAARLGDTEKIDGMKRLDTFVRAVEKRYSPEADFDSVLAHQHAISQSLGGRSVADRQARQGEKQVRRGQLPLFTD
jgi:hypothetical protein